MKDQESKTEDAVVETEVEVETPEAEEKTVTSFGDDEPEQLAPDAKAFAKMRRKNRDQKERIRVLEAAHAKSDDDNAALGAEPTLEDSDYDTKKYRDAVIQHHELKAKIDAKAKTVEDENTRQRDSYAEKSRAYQDTRADFDEDTFGEAEDVVMSVLDNVQQNALIDSLGGKAAGLIQALGRDEKRLAELGKIKIKTTSDAIAFGVATGKLLAGMKTSQRKPSTSPETRVNGDSAAMVGGDKKMERLEAEAAKTGNRTDILAYKRQLRLAS